MGRYKDPNTGNWVRETAMPIGDTLPIGSEVDYDGTTVPYGWEEVDDDPKVLWTNPNPLVAFEAQSITLSDSIANYKYYEIIFVAYANASLSQDTFLNTGKVLGTRTLLQYNDNYIRSRVVNSVGGTNVTFGQGGSYTTYGSQTFSAQNLLCVPYQVLGYK